MRRATLPGVELEYEMRGSGEHVVLIHHGIGADWFAPLFDEPGLVERYCLVRYHREGYGGSSRLAGPLTFEREAQTFRALMRHLGIERAHVVGHSASACIALQLALDAPETVHSLGLQGGPGLRQVGGQLLLVPGGAGRLVVAAVPPGEAGQHRVDPGGQDRWAPADERQRVSRGVRR